MFYNPLVTYKVNFRQGEKDTISHSRTLMSVLESKQIIYFMKMHDRLLAGKETNKPGAFY